MSEGMDQLQQAIEGWEKRYSAAVLAQREADIVLPFLRAAVEELDAFRKSGGNAETVAPTSEPVSVPQPDPVAVPETVAVDPEPMPVFAAPETAPAPLESVDVIETTPTPFPGMPNDGAATALAEAILSDDADEPDNDSISSAFGRKSIASLIEEAENKEAAS